MWWSPQSPAPDAAEQKNKTSVKNFFSKAVYSKPLCLPSAENDHRKKENDLIIDAFDFIEQGLRSKHFGVILLEVNALMVERLKVILLVLLPPDLVEASLGFPPLFLFCL